MIDMKPIDSSLITAAGYDAEARELHVRFASGQVGVYDDVPPEIHAAFLKAPSKGKYLHKHLKGTYQFRRVSP